MPKKYRKKPVEIDALQLRWDTWEAMCDHAGVGKLEDGKPMGCWLDENGNGTDEPRPDVNRIGMWIPTLEGLMLARQDDYVIKGVKGELYPCKPDIFEATYEEVGNFNEAVKRSEKAEASVAALVELLEEIKTYDHQGCHMTEGGEGECQECLIEIGIIHHGKLGINALKRLKLAERVVAAAFSLTETSQAVGDNDTSAPDHYWQELNSALTDWRETTKEI
jgi:hypothetical protein